jgi:hypothetical protein
MQIQKKRALPRNSIANPNFSKVAIFYEYLDIVGLRMFSFQGKDGLICSGCIEVVKL